MHFRTFYYLLLSRSVKLAEKFTGFPGCMGTLLRVKADDDHTRLQKPQVKWKASFTAAQAGHSLGKEQCFEGHRSEKNIFATSIIICTFFSDHIFHVCHFFLNL